jgi:DNA-directed RNA polymerase subunit beta'
MYTPTLDQSVGIYLLSKVTKGKENLYKTMDEARAAYASGAQDMTTPMSIAGKRTTLGRELLKTALPEEYRGRLDIDQPELDQKSLRALADRIAASHPGQHLRVMDNLRKLGDEQSLWSGFSVHLSDFSDSREKRDKMLREFNDRAAVLGPSGQAKLAGELKEKFESAYEVPHERVRDLGQGGGKADKASVLQILQSPLFSAWGGRMLPVHRGFGEGMSSMDYWSISPAARQALVGKVQEVRLPGDLSKQMIASAIDTVIVGKDCGSTGEVRPVDDSVDRVLGEASGAYKAGTYVTPEIASDLRKSGVSRLRLRTPLTCREGQGVCAKCYGHTEYGPAQIGDNVGIRAANSLGERATQLTLKAVHVGFRQTPPSDKLAALIRLPETMPEKAVIARAAGRVTEVRKQEDGVQVTVLGKHGTVEHFVPKLRELQVKKGDVVNVAQPISSGIVDPREVLQTTGDLKAAQHAMVDGISSLFNKFGINKKHYEVVVRSITNLARVDDSGTSPFMRDEYIPYYAAQAWNAENDGSLKVTPILKGVATLPQVRDQWLPSLGYRNIRQLLTEAAATGRPSNIHGLNPRGAMFFPTEFGSPRGKGKPQY